MNYLKAHDMTCCDGLESNKDLVLENIVNFLIRVSIDYNKIHSFKEVSMQKVFTLNKYKNVIPFLLRKIITDLKRYT